MSVFTPLLGRPFDSGIDTEYKEVVITASKIEGEKISSESSLKKSGINTIINENKKPLFWLLGGLFLIFLIKKSDRDRVQNKYR